MPYRVEVIESERGWGQKVDDVKYFENKEDAIRFVREFNSGNTSETTPDWYMKAMEPVYIKELPLSEMSAQQLRDLADKKEREEKELIVKREEEVRAKVRKIRDSLSPEELEMLKKM